MNNESLDPLYAAVFADPKNGTPDNITRAGCLALARLGKKPWNAWRSDYPVGVKYPDWKNPDWKNIADFSRVDFREHPISFDGFIFGDNARFIGAVFGHRTRFNRAQFGNNAYFIYSQFDDTCFNASKFGHHASFENTQFKNGVSFQGVLFEDHTKFNNTKFGNEPDFSGVQFGDQTEFIAAQFGCNACFLVAKFGDHVRFTGAQFGDGATFDGVRFGRSVTFKGLSWGLLTNLHYENSDELETAKFWANTQDLSPEIFKSISFAGANFAGQVDFSDRKFEGQTSFGRLDQLVNISEYNLNENDVEKELPAGHCVTFGKTPLFHNCKLHQDTTFDGAIFPEPSSNPIENDIAARAYRTLKLAFSQHQAIREEQLFFRLEMAEEAAKLVSYKSEATVKGSLFPLSLGKSKKILPVISHLLSHHARICLFYSYKLFSNYGFCFGRPLVLLLSALLVFLGIYTSLANLTPCLLTHADCQIRYDLIQFTLLQALPLPGLDKWSDSLRSDLFPYEGLKSLGFTAALMIHKTISLLAVFLFGLALRNLFKMK